MKYLRCNRSQRSKQQREIYYQHLEYLISFLPLEDQAKIKYVERAIEKILLPNVKEEDIIIIEPINCKLFKYLLFSLILNYESESKSI